MGHDVAVLGCELKLVWEKAGAYELGRWIQPTLSMAFWSDWTQNDAYAKTGLPSFSGDMALLDGHTLMRQSDYAGLVRLSKDAVFRQDASRLQGMLAVAESSIAEHERLGTRLRQRGLDLDDALQQLFISWKRLCMPWLLSIPITRTVEESVFELGEREGVSSTALTACMAPDPTLLSVHQRSLMQFKKRFADEGIALMAPFDSDDAWRRLQQNPDLADAVRRHVDDFAWVQVHKCEGPALDMATFLQHVRATQPPSEPGVAVPALSEELLFRIELHKKLSRCRLMAADVCDRAAFFARPYLEQAAERLGVSYRQLLYLAPWEIRDGLDGKPIPASAQIALRQESFGIVPESGTLRVIVGDELSFWKNAVLEKPDASQPALVGIAASSGRVRARACIAFNPSQAEALQEGQVLVTSQTTPGFVPYMRKASAIVTDEGGVTCHAAIVSRELGKPCVVGTKHATEVFKSGDWLDVDATAGVVRKCDG